MTRQQIGTYMIWGGYGAGVVAGVLTLKNPWVFSLIFAAIALVLVGRFLEKPGISNVERLVK